MLQLLGQGGGKGQLGGQWGAASLLLRSCTLQDLDLLICSWVRLIRMDQSEASSMLPALPPASPAQAGAPKPSLLQLLRAPILAKLEPEGEGRILNAHLQVRHHLVIIIIIMNAHLQVRHHLVIIIKRCSGSI